MIGNASVHTSVCAAFAFLSLGYARHPYVRKLKQYFLSRFFVVYPQYNSGKPALNPLIATTHAQ